MPAQQCQRRLQQALSGQSAHPMRPQPLPAQPAQHLQRTIPFEGASPENGCKHSCEQSGCMVFRCVSMSCQKMVAFTIVNTLYAQSFAVSGCHAPTWAIHSSVRQDSMGQEDLLQSYHSFATGIHMAQVVSSLCPMLCNNKQCLSGSCDQTDKDWTLCLAYQHLLETNPGHVWIAHCWTPAGD